MRDFFILPKMKIKWRRIKDHLDFYDFELKVVL
jgi:hypothetical protein